MECAASKHWFKCTTLVRCSFNNNLEMDFISPAEILNWLKKLALIEPQIFITASITIHGIGWQAKRPQRPWPRRLQLGLTNMAVMESTSILKKGQVLIWTEKYNKFLNFVNSFKQSYWCCCKFKLKFVNDGQNKLYCNNWIVLANTFLYKCFYTIRNIFR